MYCEKKKKICIASLAIVLQESGLEKNCSKNCIAIPFLYCREEGLRAGSCIAIQQIVLQECVVGWEEKLYCKTVYCIAGWEGSVPRYNFCIVTEAVGFG